MLQHGRFSITDLTTKLGLPGKFWGFLSKKNSGGSPGMNWTKQGIVSCIFIFFIKLLHRLLTSSQRVRICETALALAILAAIFPLDSGHLLSSGEISISNNCKIQLQSQSLREETLPSLVQGWDCRVFLLITNFSPPGTENIPRALPSSKLC